MLACQQGGPDQPCSSSNSLKAADVAGGCSLSLPSCQSVTAVAPACSTNTQLFLPQLATMAARGSTAVPEPVYVTQLYRGMCRYNPLGPRVPITTMTAATVAATPEDNFGVYPTGTAGGTADAACSAERGVTRSPVNFREGRRASDGLAQQGMIAFQQKLYAKERAAAMVQQQQQQQQQQLFNARQEVLQLQSQLSTPPARPTAAVGHHLDNVWNSSSGSSCQSAGLHSISCCHQQQAAAAALSSRHVALQQQLLQHRLQQKRHHKHQQQRYAMMSTAGESAAPNAGSGSANTCVSGAGNSSGHRRPVFISGKPYLPVEAARSLATTGGGSGGGGGGIVGGASGGSGGSGNEYLFHPIAEDEPYSDASCHAERRRQEVGHMAWQPIGEASTSMTPPPPLLDSSHIGGADEAWGMLEGLPGQMERGCKLTADGSPPPLPLE
jgi:hypothetical protein